MQRQLENEWKKDVDEKRWKRHTSAISKFTFIFLCNKLQSNVVIQFNIDLVISSVWRKAIRSIGLQEGDF